MNEGEKQSTCFFGLKENNLKKLMKILIIAQEDVELLILYFGPESKGSEKVDILDETSNDGKNDLIVELLESLSGDLLRHYQNVKQGIAK